MRAGRTVVVVHSVWLGRSLKCYSHEPLSALEKTAGSLCLAGVEVR